MEECTLINKNRTRIKVFKIFKDVRNSSPFIDAMEISSKCVYKRANKQVMIGKRVESFKMPEKNIRNY